jgi:tetratricopeptide (TPR) repeat protein
VSELLLLVVLGQSVLAGCPAPDVAPTLRGAPDLPAARLTLLRCVRADLRVGEWDAADARLSAARRTGATLAASDAAAWRDLVDRLTGTRVIDARAWDEAPSLTSTMSQGSWLGTMVTAIAEARRAWGMQDANAFARVLAVAEDLQAQAVARRDQEITRAAQLVQAAAAGGQYERDEMQLLLEQAYRTEVALHDALGELYVPVVLAAELEADLWLQTDRYARAAEVYRAVIADYPDRVQSWLGLADAYRRLGHLAEADVAEAQALTIAPRFRTSRPAAPR